MRPCVLPRQLGKPVSDTHLINTYVSLVLTAVVIAIPSIIRAFSGFFLNNLANIDVYKRQANILVATKKDFEPKNRKKFCARIATGEYAAVIIGHSQFEKIPVSMERQQRELARPLLRQVVGKDVYKRQIYRHLSSISEDFWASVAESPATFRIFV